MTIGNPKKAKKLSSFTKMLLRIVDDYKKATNEVEPDLNDVAAWAFTNGLMDLPRIDPFKILAQQLARACRQDHFVDENGEPVRRRHAVKEKRGDKQLTIWPNMEDMTPAKIRTSLTSRRKGSGQDILQIERDRRYYNKYFNPGDPIEMDYDYNKDVEEHFMPTEYPDAPPQEPQE